jgi:hypothetical protein
MDEKRAATERSLTRDLFAPGTPDPRPIPPAKRARRRWRRGGPSGAASAPVEPRGGGGLSGGAEAVAELED